MRNTPAAARDTLPKLSIADSLALISEVVLPNIGKGPIIRRPKVVAGAQALDLDRTAVKCMQRLRRRYGDGPVMVRVPFRRQAVILSGRDVRRVLDATPEPFATASSEKVHALEHLEPKGALVSHGPERAERRRYNEEVLDFRLIMHRLAERFETVVREEAESLLSEVLPQKQLTWQQFSTTWFRVVRRVVFGDSARDDHQLRELVDTLRSRGNWGPFVPKQTKTRDQFFERLHQHLARAEEGSLAAVMAATHATDTTAPSHQVPQWLFAFDPAGMTTYRALALLATHPRKADKAHEEISRWSAEEHRHLPYLRAIVLESLRLWPTTPLLLRQSTRATQWENGTMPADTGILIFAPFFHRDDERLPHADIFMPEFWQEDNTPVGEWPLVPFSGGTGACPGQNLVLLVTSTMLAELFSRCEFRMTSAPRMTPYEPLPATLDNYGVTFQITPRGGTGKIAAARAVSATV
jgi:cytochrome P450